MFPVARFSSTATAPVAVIGTADTLNYGSATAAFDVSLTVPAGGANRACLVAVTFDNGGSSGATISSVVLDPGGSAVAFTEDVQQDAGSNLYHAGIYSARLPSAVSGSLTLRVTASGTLDTVTVSVLYLSGVISMTPTFTDSATGTGTLTATSVTAEIGGVTFGIGMKDTYSQTLTWPTLTEQAEGAGGTSGNDHNHSVAWDLQPTGRAAADEAVTVSGGSAGNLCVASYR